MSYYIRIRGKTFGPFDEVQLVKMKNARKIGRTTDVSDDGVNWKSAESFAVLFPSSSLPEPDPFSTAPLPLMVVPTPVTKNVGTRSPLAMSTGIVILLLLGGVLLGGATWIAMEYGRRESEDRSDAIERRGIGERQTEPTWNIQGESKDTPDVVERRGIGERQPQAEQAQDGRESALSPKRNDSTKPLVEQDQKKVEFPTAKTNGFIEAINRGFPSDAIQITTAAQLAAIGGVHGENKYFVLAKDINLTTEWMPIDDFRGTFDGQGFTVNNLRLSATSNRQYAGLFGKINANGVVIKNVGVNIGRDGITGSSGGGGLIGFCKGTITVTNCYSTGNVDGTSGTGGMIGTCDGIITVENCYSTANAYEGGLIGACNGTVTVLNFYATGNSAGGGLIGFIGSESYGQKPAKSITVKNSYSAGVVSGKKNLDLKGAAGGLIASCIGEEITIENCFATSAIFNLSEMGGSPCPGTGGLIGIYSSGKSGKGKIRNCFASGSVSAKSNAGGLIGCCEGVAVVTGCYAVGDVTVGDKDPFAGGLVGTSSWTGTLTITDCYATGNISAHGGDSIARGTAGGIVGRFFADGALTIKRSYVTGNISAICGAGGLIGYCGGYINAGGHTKPMTVEIEECYTIGNVSSIAPAKSSSYAGGLIGHSIAHDRGNTPGHQQKILLTIKNCYTTGDIASTADSSSQSVQAFAGGLIGYSKGAVASLLIEKSYATGKISAMSTHPTYDNSHAGGLIGLDDSKTCTVNNCYRLSTQTIKGNSILINPLGMSLAPRQMQTQTSFTDWDFNTVWGFKMDANNGYPILRTIQIEASHVILNKAERRIDVALADPDFKWVHDHLVQENPIEMRPPAVPGETGNKVSVPPQSHRPQGPVSTQTGKREVSAVPVKKDAPQPSEGGFDKSGEGENDLIGRAYNCNFLEMFLPKRKSRLLNLGGELTPEKIIETLSVGGAFESIPQFEQQEWEVVDNQTVMLTFTINDQSDTHHQDSRELPHARRSSS